MITMYLLTEWEGRTTGKYLVRGQEVDRGPNIDPELSFLNFFFLVDADAKTLISRAFLRANALW